MSYYKERSIRKYSYQICIILISFLSINIFGMDTVTGIYSNVDYLSEPTQHEYFKLSMSEQQEHFAAIQKHLASKKNPNETLSGYQHRPLFEAMALKNGQALVQQLLENGAEYLAKTNCMLSVMHIAAIANTVACAQVIIDFYKKKNIPIAELINAQTKYGAHTALHYSCNRMIYCDESDDNNAVIRLLLEHGADFNRTDNHGEPPFFALKNRLFYMSQSDMAARKKQKMLELCEQYNANFLIKDNDDKTLFDHMKKRFTKLDESKNIASPGMVIYAHIYHLRFDAKSYLSKLPSDLMHQLGDIMSKGHRPNLTKGFPLEKK